MIMILTTMNLQISSDTLYTAKYINSIKKKETAYYACKSAVNSARDYIKAGYKEDPKELYDSLKYLESAPLNFDTSDIKINIEIQDLERKFSVNSIVSGDEQEQRDRIEYLKRIFNGIGINSTNVNKIADWIDTDNNIRVDGNENSLKYGSVKNAKIDSLNELNLIDYLKDDIKEFKESKVEGADNLDYYLSSYGLSYPKININTANRLLLRCLTDDMTEQDIDNIIEHRPIKDSYELDSIIGADTKKVYEMKKFVDYKSRYFQIKASAVYDEESIVIRTVVDKSGNIVYWGVE